MINHKAIEPKNNRTIELSKMLRIIPFLLLCISTFAQQNYFFEHISLEKGLSQGSGYAVAQYDGYLWMGTQDGLNRYDGYGFRVFRSDEPDGVNDNFIQGFLHDSQNRFWVATVKGICLYDKATESFKTFDKHFKINHLVSHVSVRNIQEDSQKNIWIITDENGIYCFNPATHQLKSYFEKANNFIEFEKSKDGKLWLLSDEDVYLFDAQSAKFLPQNIKKVLGFSNKNVLRAIVTDHQSNLWLGTYEDGVFVLSPERKLLKHFTKGNDEKSLSSNEIKCFLRDSENRIWIGTRNAGISLYNPDNQSFIKISNNKTEPKSLGKNYVLSFFEDLQSNIWVGLSGGGFDKYDPRKYRFQVIEQNLENPSKSLSDNMVFKVMGHEKYLYFGTQAGGLARMDTLTQAFKIYKPIRNDPNSILHSEVYDISEDKNQHLWLATGRGLCEFIPQKQVFHSYLRQDKEPSLYLFSARVLSHQKELWAGGQRGIFRFDLLKKQWKDWSDLPEIEHISKYVVRVIYEDSKQNIWFGTLGHGLVMYSPKTNKIKVFDDKNDLKCANIRSIYEDKTQLWIGSDCGLFKLNLPNLSIEKQFSIKNGLVNNVIYGILQDSDKNLWLSSNRGLMKFSAEQGLLKSYNQNEGLSSNEFNSNCTFQKSDGTLYFGSIGGVTFFNPKNLKANDFSPQVRITKIKVLDNLFSPQTKELRLNYQQNFIDFEYSTFNFSNTESNTYQHRLVGIEDDWVEDGTNQTTRYTNLPHGEYVFKVKSRNADGIENPNETSLKIIIEPPFWQTRWFRGLLVIGLLLGIYLIFVNRIRQIRKEEARKTELQHIRSQAEMVAMKAQINPHFIFNCLNTVDSYILTNQRKEASRFLQVFSQLIRLVLENSGEELVNIKQDLEALKLYISLEEERYEHRFKTVFDIDKKVLEADYRIPPMLLQPFVENAIIHGLRHRVGSDGELKISLQLTDSQLFIEISDNGIGRKASAEINQNRATYHQSKGLDLTIQRIKALGELYDSPSSYEVMDLAQGTKVCIRIPVRG